MAAVVSDASVLICLGAAGQIHLLRDFYQEVVVPDAVWREVTVAAASLPGAKEAALANQEGWLKVRTPAQPGLVATLRGALDEGEAEAIALASELRARLLLIDETEGRTAARALGLTVTGTLGVLLRGKREGKVAALKPVLDGLMGQHGFRLGRQLYEQVLREVGEVP
jgi:hypothetical protein